MLYQYMNTSIYDTLVAPVPGTTVLLLNRFFTRGVML